MILSISLVAGQWSVCRLRSEAVSVSGPCDDDDVNVTAAKCVNCPGVKLRHSLEPNKYPYVSPSMVNLKYNEDITDTARYPLVKAHGLLQSFLIISLMLCRSGLAVERWACDH